MNLRIQHDEHELKRGGYYGWNGNTPTVNSSDEVVHWDGEALTIDGKPEYVLEPNSLKPGEDGSFDLLKVDIAARKKGTSSSPMEKVNSVSANCSS